VNGGYRDSRREIYMFERTGVAVRSRTRTVPKAKRLAQVVRRGVTGKEVKSRVNSPAAMIHDKRYSKYFEALYIPNHMGVRSIGAPRLAEEAERSAYKEA
jgi:dihydroorotate dehydrogenase